MKRLLRLIETGRVDPTVPDDADQGGRDPEAVDPVRVGPRW
jgi:hypothetical protein